MPDSGLRIGLEEKILLVLDDDPGMGEFVAHVGELAGFDVMVTSNAKEFQDSYLSKAVSGIVMDVAMPDMDAAALCGWLSEKKCSTPVILMSGYGDSILDWAENIGKNSNISILATFSKPVSVAKLKNALKKI